MTDIDLSKPFVREPFVTYDRDDGVNSIRLSNDTVYVFLQHSRSHPEDINLANAAFASGSVSALERARAEIQVIYNDTSSLRHEEFYRGLVEARDAVTRLLETKP